MVEVRFSGCFTRIGHEIGYRLNQRLLSSVKPTHTRDDWRKHEENFWKYKKNITNPHYTYFMNSNPKLASVADIGGLRRTIQTQAKKV